VNDLVIYALPKGIGLSWSPVSGANGYVVYGSVSSRFDGEYKELARIQDTTFTDWDDTFSSRFYEVTALIGQNPALTAASGVERRAASGATLRPPDFKWNRKLQSRHER
jgi:hypothetical protein